MIRVSKFQRPTGYWYVRYWTAGRAVDEAARTKDEGSAESYRIRRELEINAGIQPLRHARVSELVTLHLEAMPPKTSAIHVHEARRILDGFLRICGHHRRDGSFDLRTEQLTPQLIDQYLRRRQGVCLHQGDQRDSCGRKIVRKRPVSNVTLRKELRYLSGFLNWCCRQRPPYLRENPIPLSNASHLKNDAKPHFMITDDEFHALLRACETPRQYLFLLLGWWTGARRSELKALHYYHFDTNACTVTVAHQKNNMHSVLPLSQRIMALVQELYRSAQEADPLFAQDPFPSHSFGKFCSKANIRPHRFHDLRISTSMKIKCGGFDASLAGLWVGNQATTNRVHYTDLGGAAQRIASLLESSVEMFQSN